MKISPNYVLANANISGNKFNQSFGQNSVNTADEKKVLTLPVVSPDYNITAPMPYSFIENVKLSDDLTAKCYKLANGQKVIIVPKDGTTVVKTYVNTGSLNEPDNIRGISHYIEHNLFNGSEALGDKVFFDEVNKMGAKTNASTSFSVTDYYISSNLLDDNDLETKIKLHAGMIQSPKFLLDKLEKEKKIVNSEINMCLSDDENVGYTETLKNLFNVKSSSIDLVAGSTDNITALTRDDVVNYFNNNYYPANMTTVITGEIEPEETMALISKYFTSKKSPVHNRHFEKMIPIEHPIRRDIISAKSEGAASIFLGFAGPENADTKDKIYLDALSTLMVDLANSKVSDLERKYSTFVRINSERLGTRTNDKSATIIETEIPDNYVEPFLKDMYKTIDNLSKNSPTEDELTSVKNKLKKNQDAVFENSHALNNKLGVSFLNNNPNYLKEYDDIVNNMTTQDIVNTAKKYLDLNKVSLTVVHPSKTTPESIKENYKSAADISFTGLNKKAPINKDKISEYRMQNNYNVILNDVNSNTVEYRFNLSQKDWTPKKAAIADVLSDMLQNCGTKNKNREQISSTFDLLGVDMGISADNYGLYLSADFPVENSQKALDIFRELIQSPDFLTDNTFEQAIQHCKDYYITQEVSAYDKFDKVMYNNTPYSITSKDKLNSLSNITIDDIKNFYNEIFQNAQGQVVVSGAFSKHPELRSTVFNDTSKYNMVKPKDISLVEAYSPIDKAQVFTVEHKKNQAQIIEGFKFKRNGNVKDAVCLSLLNEILGGSPSSRLFSDLRETRHLGYSVSSDYDNVEDIGILSLHIGTTTENHETGEKSFENIQKSINGFNENIKKISTEKVSQEELDAAKKALKTSMLSIMEINSGKTSVIAKCDKTPYGVDYVNKKLEIIDQIMADDILNTAKNVFSTKPIYSIAATRASLEANKDFLDSLK